jgi:hypothetical protein
MNTQMVSWEAILRGSHGAVVKYSAYLFLNTYTQFDKVLLGQMGLLSRLVGEAGSIDDEISIEVNMTWVLLETK